MNTEAEQQITSLQCAHCQVTIETLNDKVMHLMKQAEQAQPVAFLAKGTRFKMSFFDSERDGCGNAGTYVTCFEGWEKELDGRWVALVAAEDDCHRKITAQPPRQPLTDEQIEEINVSLNGTRDLARMFARAIEAAHGIKGKA